MEFQFSEPKTAEKLQSSWYRRQSNLFGQRPGGFKGKKARQMFILQGLPGIGRRKAELLIEKFGSVEAVVNAKSEDLSTVYGMGEKTIEDIKNVLRENSLEYL